MLLCERSLLSYARHLVTYVTTWRMVTSCQCRVEGESNTEVLAVKSPGHPLRGVRPCRQPASLRTVPRRTADEIPVHYAHGG